MASIAVIIVNYNAAALVLAGVKSVLDRPADGHDVTIHLIDNASPEGDAAVLAEAAQTRDWGERVVLYPETVNHGFGRGNNIALRAVSAQAEPPEFIFLLNPDAQITEHTLARLVTFLEAHPKAAMAGTRAYNPGDPEPVTAAFRFPGAISTFVAALNFGPVARAFARWQVPIGADLPTQRVDWVSGAAVLVRRAVWETLDFFDPEYFLYYEEVDLMLRTQRAGWECWHVREAEILHVEGASTEVKGAHNGPRRRPPYWYHSWQYYFRKNHGRAYALWVALAWMTGAALNLVLARLRGQPRASPHRFFGDFTTYALRPLLGVQKSADLP